MKIEVKPFRLKDYQRIFACSTADQVENLKIIGASSATVVHDPTKEKTPDRKLIEGPIKFEKPAPFTVTEVKEETDPVVIARKSEDAHVAKKTAARKVIRRKR